MIKTVIFDFDGVLVESLDIKTEAFRKLFLPEGEDIAGRVVEYHIANSGVSRYDKFRYVYKEMLDRPLDDDTFDSLCGRFSRLVAEEVIKAPYVDGALEFLRTYSDKYAFYICSATPLEELISIVYGRNMSSYFRKIYGSPQKKTDIVKDILDKNALSPGEVVYVGDAMSDYNAATGNSVNFVGRSTHDKAGLFSDLDCVEVENLKGLDDIINNM